MQGIVRQLIILKLLGFFGEADYRAKVRDKAVFVFGSNIAEITIPSTDS